MTVENHDQLEKRIIREERRLARNYKDMDVNRKSVIVGLIRRAAFMRVSLEDLEDDINANGFTELFSQGDQEPYERERPSARIYNAMNGGYQKIIKQLTDLLPRDDAKSKGGDSFDGF